MRKVRRSQETLRLKLLYEYDTEDNCSDVLTKVVEVCPCSCNNCWHKRFVSLHLTRHRSYEVGEVCVSLLDL
ncbi:Plakophilin-4 [Dissostichus eleginoides]|uniref:Plakophilin-4 n=1 Tax=Dissostichus eleginoides TaxID=100907 RepID=A0AAD9BG40_DISEL|nr:Plakophilin-4 [Dissostichus eleginoides]